MPPVTLVNLDSLPRTAFLSFGRFVPYTTARKPGQAYVIDRLTGTHMRLETARRRWPEHFQANGRPK